MTFTVLWSDAAERELTSIWLASDDRASLTRAANELDRRLQNDPQNEGESRDAGRRIVLVPPLAVTVEVQPNDRIVRVIHVQEFRQLR
ncbi:MAG: hypothetical protein H8E37_09160 [Planctomycetes bacterium]|nr:hypothetical protein [Planctomycetota bacterium]